MSVHENHRQRVKNRFLKEGLDNFDDVHILELMLFYCIPRRDTNQIAHNLLERFGSVPNVLDAQPEQLKQVEGVGESVATFIRFIRELEQAKQIRRSNHVQIINSYWDIRACLQTRMDRHRNEAVYILCMDAKRKLLSVEKVGEGSVNSASVPVRRIVELALAANATSVILAHNHPGGLAIPSAEDVSATLQVGKALYTVDVELLDHIVTADGEFVSLQQSGLYHFGMVKK